MQTLKIYANELVAVADLFGSVAVAIRRWAENFIAFAEADEDEEAESTPDEEEDNKAPPTLGILVKDSVDTKDIFGK